MDEQLALQYLKTACIPSSDDDASLRAEWQSARDRLGPAWPNAGHPEIRDIPPGHEAYLDQLRQTSWVVEDLQGPAWDLKLIEIDPLLAFQFDVNTNRSTVHCGNLFQSAQLDALLPICLPQTLENIPFQIVLQEHCALIKSPSLNLRTLRTGVFQQPIGAVAGVYFRPSLPLIQVARFNGRCYLANGFHRAYGLRRAGVTHMPCVLRDLASWEDVGVRPRGTFQPALLESNDPPAIAHFAHERAYPVTLRENTRILHISWAEHGLPNE
jgi:hypothetical protein